MEVLVIAWKYIRQQTALSEQMMPPAHLSELDFHDPAELRDPCILHIYPKAELAKYQRKTPEQPSP